GANFHVWLREYRKDYDENEASAEITTPHEVVLCAEAEASLDQVAHLFSATSYRLPPKAWPFIDKIQLLGVLLAEKVFLDQGISPALLDRDNIHVVTGIGTSLDLYYEWAERVVTDYALQYVALNHPDRKAEVEKVKEKALSGFSEMNGQFILG